MFGFIYLAIVSRWIISIVDSPTSRSICKSKFSKASKCFLFGLGKWYSVVSNSCFFARRLCLVSSIWLMHISIVSQWYSQRWQKYCALENFVDLWKIKKKNIQGVKAYSGKSLCSKFGSNQCLYCNKRYIRTKNPWSQL